ncbi:MAG: hypothetical protein D6689_16315 [Deltaproteobacteria bacterium]|nr:MAG: hypothetical protein D6689_16315 [Deltaproteobacteria bacterium]
MARIRIVDAWRRNPTAPPVYGRAVMVVAETWAEQRVLMRAFRACRDQTRPAIVLRGAALAIGPAGVEPHGPWGIHVDRDEPGRAQQLRAELERAARRLAGARRNPPRLADEESAFERKPTNLWSPGAPRDRESQGPLRTTPFEPVELPRPPAAKPSPRRASVVPVAPPPHGGATIPSAAVAEAPPHGGATISSPAVAEAWMAAADPAARTVACRGPHAPAGGPPPAAGCSPGSADRSGALAQLVGRTMPLGFRLSAAERDVLDALGRAGRLSAAEVADIAACADGAAWMSALIAKLSAHGLDLVVPADAAGGEPTYVLRR